MVKRGLWIVCLLACVQWTSAQGQVSGNALDLANMNMNMMNTKCPLEACQSVCLTKNQETGCFVCNPKCTSGTNLAMPETGLPMQMNSGQGAFYSACKQDTWMQCPFSCARALDQKGCFKCLCQSSTNIKATTNPTPSLQERSTTTSSLVNTKRPLPTLYNTVSTKRTSVNTVKQTATTESHTEQRPFISLAKSSPTPYVTTKITQDDHVRTRIPLHLDKTTATVKNVTNNLNNSFDNFGKPTTTYKPSGNNSETNTQNWKDHFNGNVSEKDDFQMNNLTFILFAIMIVLATFCFVLLIAWKKSSRKLKRNKNELYFVQKAYRQDSNARLSNNEMLDPVYADIGPRPEPPPRSPPSLRTTSVTTELERGLSQTSETPLKELIYNVKHDYLELI